MDPPETPTVSRGHEQTEKDNVAPAERSQHVDSGSIGKSGPGRKPRACIECKRQKMKCEVLAGSRKCRNCSRRCTECSLMFKKPTLPDRQQTQSSAMSSDCEARLSAMQQELHHVRSVLDGLVRNGVSLNPPSANQPGLTQPENATTTPHSNAATTVLSELSQKEDNMQMAMTRENSMEPASSCDQGSHGEVTVDEPMSSLYEVTRLRNIRSNQAKTARPLLEGEAEINDFITRGVISETEAQELYISFHTSLNHYLWVGLEQIHTSLESVRRSSQLLTATILAVTALHKPTSAETFDRCYKEFLSLISSSMFSRYHSIDDVRGLCIAAFWLSDVSWKLSGHAIRIATELNIHQSFYRALNGEREHFLRARLWYMLYVCDHHFSIAYSRPPMISESLQIREHELFLQVPLADALDQRILSQVSLMQILTRVHDRFAERRLPQQDPAGAALSDSDFVDMRHFNGEIDQWRMKWHARQESNQFIGTFPPKGIILYSYFAKLQLNSLAVRGVSISHGCLSTERKEFANHAISAAASVLTFVLEEEDMRRALVGTPLYVHTMIAFASVFLMKVTTKWNRIIGLNVEPNYVLELLKRMIALLKSSITSDRHLLHHIAAGLEKMLDKSQASSPGIMTMVPEQSSDGHLPPIPSSSHFDRSASDQHGYAHHPSQGFQNGLQTPSSWYQNPVNENQTDFNDMMIMNDGWIEESFGSNPAHDVYNLLTSQFSY